MSGSKNSLTKYSSILSKSKKDREYDEDEEDQTAIKADERDGKRARIDDDDYEKNGKSGGGVDEDEWARFQTEVLQSASNLDSTNQNRSSTKANKNHNAIATIEAEPILNDQSNQSKDDGIDDIDDLEDEDESNHRKIQREEHEEILSRLDEEQRAQEEADQRVKALKDRLERFRENRKANKTKQQTKAS